MGKHKVTIFRPRLERIVVTVSAPSRYAAGEKAFEKAETMPPEAWELLRPEACFYAGASGYDNTAFTTDAEIIHHNGNEFVE